MANFIDLTGKKFGMLEVVSRADNYEKFSKTHNRVLKYARWNCVCECGNQALAVLATDLKSKSQVSCGCHKMKILLERVTSHNMTYTKEYFAWQNMKTRCTNENSSHYDNYGGRGITIQDNWLNDFERFFEHIGPAPSEKHSVDRIDTNGNYEEGNVKWSTVSEQAQNTRKPKSGKNKYKWVSFDVQSMLFRTVFVLHGEKYSTGSFVCEDEAARSIYRHYKALTGEWPKYCDEALVELCLL